MLDHLNILLVDTTHPGNIGAAARAMKTMGLRRLRLVNPKTFPCAEATARASGADDLLAAAEVYTSLDEALADCRLVVGTSARLRSVSWPQLDPREAARLLLTEARLGPVALVFGRESSGLSNQELDRCHYLVNIPANPEYSSLNLAAAVQVLGYEIRMTSLETGPKAPQPETPPEDSETPADGRAMASFFGHLEASVFELGFAKPTQSRKLLRRLHRLFLRARPSLEEINILRGLLRAATWRKSGGC